MGNKVKALLQQINFIDADMELHKQILVSIPSDDKEQIQTVIEKIAEQKKQIEQLRQQIKETDEAEYNKMIAIERAADEFKRIANTKKFVHVDTLNETGECFITLTDGTRIDCLVAAKEENGNWTIMTIEGETKEYPSGIIR